MSVFKRAEWHSGLTYRQTCRECKTVVEYTDHKLDFRPWFPDGFVYCPKCETPLRHSEEYALEAPEKQEVASVTAGAQLAEIPLRRPVAVEETAAPEPAAAPGEALSAFCHQCGKKFREDDIFCSGCGTKRR